MSIHSFARRAVFGLAVAVLLPLTIRAAPVDKYLPDDAQIVMSINVQQIVKSELFKKYLAPLVKPQHKNNEFMQVMDAVGLNPLTDLIQVTVAGPMPKNLDSTPAAARQYTGRDSLTVVHGNFNPVKLHDAADAFAGSNPGKLKVEKASGTKIYALQDEGHAIGYAALLGKNVLVVSGSKARVLDAVAKDNGTRQSKVLPALRELVRQVNGKQSIWIAALVPDQVKNRMTKAQRQAAFLKQIDAISGGLTLTDAIELNVDAHMATAEAADELTNLLRFAVPLGVGIATSRPELKDYAPVVKQVTQAMRFSSAKKVASLKLVIDQKLIHQISEAAKSIGTPPPNAEKP
jgi:hypothetical protein